MVHSIILMRSKQTVSKHAKKTINVPSVQAIFIFILILALILYLASMNTWASVSETDSQGRATNRQYRNRVEKLMKADGYLSRLWRSRRSFPYAQKASELCHKNKHREALNVYDTYLAVDQKHLLMQWDRLVLLEYLQENQRIEIAASAFLEQVNEFGPVLLLRAFARKNLHRFEVAEKDLQNALKDPELLEEDQRAAKLELIFSAYQRKDYDEALRWCDQLIKSGPLELKDLIFRAGLLEKVENWQAATEQWRQIIAKGPEDIILRRAILARTVLLLRLDAQQAAFSSLLAAKESSVFDTPNTPPMQREKFYALLAQLAEKMEKVDLAVHSYEALGTSNMDNNRRLALAKLYIRKDRPEKVVPLLFEISSAPLNHPEELKYLLDLVHLMDQRHQFHSALNLLEHAMPIAEGYYRHNMQDKDGQNIWIQFLAVNANLKRKIGDVMRAEKIFARLVQVSGNYQHEMDYAALLTANGKPMDAIKILNRVIQRSDLPDEHRALAYAAIASAYARTGQWMEEANAWQSAYAANANAKAIYRLYSIQAFLKTGAYGNAAEALNDFPVEQLTEHQQLSLYETAAEVWQERGDLEKSRMAWQKAASLQPNALYYCQVSDILLARNQLKDALAAIQQALQIEPGNRDALERGAYIMTRLGNDDEAAIFFERLKQCGGERYQTDADLGFVYTRMHKNELAFEHLKLGVDKALALKADDVQITEEKERALLSMRRQIAEMERKFELVIAESFHSLNNEDGVFELPSSTQWFNMGVGVVEAGYRPGGIGYQSGRTLTLFGRIMWPNRSESIAPEKETLQAGLGCKYKPFKSSNFLVSLEYLYGLGNETDDRPLMRVAHSATFMPSDYSSASGLSWLARNLPYRQFYTDIGKEFGNDNAWFITHETRIGMAFAGRNDRIALPFGYFQGNAIACDNEDYAQIETGVGISLRWPGAFDRYKGYRREVECLLRCGYVVHDSNEDEGISALLGLRVSFF